MILLLDIDGVLQFPRASFAAALEREYTWRDSYAAFLGELFTDPAYGATLEGRADFREVANRVLKRHTPALGADEFLRRWALEGIELNQALLTEIPALGYEQVYLASNQEPLRGAYVERLYADHAWLTGTFLSHRVGSSKPSLEYFARVLGRLGCAPTECVFVDDSPGNIAAAAAAGLRSIQFETTDQALAALRLY